MSNPNLLISDLQSLEITSPVVALYELIYDDSTTLYFHPGLSTSVRITSIDGTTLTLNSSQDLSVGTTLTITGLDKDTGATVTTTKTVQGGNPNNNTVVINSNSSVVVGMTVTGPGISTTDFSPIVFDGNTYYAMPLVMTDLEISTEGVQNRPTLTIGNVESILRSSSEFQNANDGGSDGIANFSINRLIGKRLTKRQTLQKYLTIESSTASTKAIVEYPKRTYIIDRVQQRTAEAIIFELANPFDLEGVKLPSRQVIGKYCPWAYQGLSFSTPTGGCSWAANGEMVVDDEGTERKYYVYFTDLDEPIVWKYLIHNAANNNIQSGKLHNGSSGTYAKGVLVALSDGGSGYTYWRSEIDNNSSVPAVNNSSWQQVRVYVPFVSGETYSVHSTDSMRNEYVVHPVNNATGKNDTTFDFTATSNIFRVLITNSTATPVSFSDYWERGDQCGKILKSCKIRYQFRSAKGASGVNQNTVPLVELETKQSLPFGGFPGSRKI